MQKTILITGASYGIGAELAYQLAAPQVHLLLVARTEDRLLDMQAVVECKGSKATIFAVDLRDQTQLNELIQSLKTLEGGIDIVVSNAGKSIRRSIYDSLDRYHDFDRTMALNYHAPVQLILALIPMLTEKKGQIINVSAVNVLLIPAPYWAAYQASKTAFDQWFRSIAPELNAQGIATTSIYLPLVRTRMIEPTKAYKNMPAMSPITVAKIIMKTMKNRRQKYKPWWLIFGQLASVIFRTPWEMLLPYFMKKKN